MRRNKKVTLVEGLSTAYDYSKILKFFKREYNCNGSMSTEKKQILLSGDHREDIGKFFEDEGICEPKNIKIHGM